MVEGHDSSRADRELDLDLLEKIIVNIFSKIKEQNIIPLDVDYYWEVSGEEIYDIYQKPEQLDIGQLSEDYTFLCEAYRGNFLVQPNLRKVAALLRYLSERKMHDMNN